MKLAAGFGLLAVLCFPLSARAEGDDTTDGGNRLRLETGFGILTSQSDDTGITQMHVGFAPEFTFGGGRFTIAPFFAMGTTSIDLRQKGGMPFDTSLTLPWQPSLGARLGVRLFRYEWFDLSLRGEFEFPLSENSAYISSFTPQGDLAALDIDIDTLRNHVTVSHLWTRAAVTARLGAHVGWWHPYVDVGLLHIDSRLAVQFDEEALALLNGADVSPDRYYSDSYSSFYYLVGSDFDLGHGFGLRVGVTLLPTDNSVFFRAEAGLLIPISLPGL